MTSLYTNIETAPTLIVWSSRKGQLVNGPEISTCNSTVEFTGVKESLNHWRKPNLVRLHRRQTNRPMVPDQLLKSLKMSDIPTDGCSGTENDTASFDETTYACLCHPCLSGWWFQPLWKILLNGKDYPIYYGKIKNVPNHQPVFLCLYLCPLSCLCLLLPCQRVLRLSSCDVTSKSPVGDISVVTLIRTELHYYNITLHHANLHYTTPHYTTTTTTLEIDRQIVSRTEGEIERHREKVTERIRERERLRSSTTFRSIILALRSMFGQLVSRCPIG